MNILAVGAHPDDIELQCAGTLAKYAAQGHNVFLAIATNGEVGSAVYSKSEIARIRELEATTSAEVIGAKIYWLGYPDEFLFENAHIRLRFIELIRETRADIIFTHDPSNDYHPDHLTTGQIVWNIRVMTTVPNIKTENPPCERVPDLYFMDTLAGINFIPEIYVDISDVIDKKRAMLAAHKSQGDWLKDQYDMSYIDFMNVCSAYRGLQAGVKYAEGFRRSVTYPSSSLVGNARSLPH